MQWSNIHSYAKSSTNDDKHYSYQETFSFLTILLTIRPTAAEAISMKKLNMCDIMKRHSRERNKERDFFLDLSECIHIHISQNNT